MRLLLGNVGSFDVFWCMLVNFEGSILMKKCLFHVQDERGSRPVSDIVPVTCFSPGLSGLAGLALT